MSRKRKRLRKLLMGRRGWSRDEAEKLIGTGLWLGLSYADMIRSLDC